jgi:ATPase family associated with various cellular activities (AAA)
MSKRFNTVTELMDMIKTNRKKKKLPNVQNFMEDVIWLEDDVSISYEILPEYAIEWQMYFGANPRSEISFGDVCIQKKCLNDCYSYLKENGFIIIEQASKGNRKFINFHKKIIIELEDGRRDGKKDEDEDYPARNHISVDFYHHSKHKEFINELVNNMLEWIDDESEKKNNFYMIAQSQEGLYNQKTSFKAIPIKDNRWDLYYGSKFPHDKFVKFVTDDSTEKLMLLWGNPGSGKSNYIKHLISNSNRNVIYIPPSMLNVIADPSFVSYMMSNRGSILLLEDCENILSSNRTTATSNLLGLTSGFLEDAMNLKIIATFNADIKDVDPALLRKGRLYCSYEFGELKVDEANKLAEFCDIDHTFKEDVTLAEIFNVSKDSSDLLKEERPMGFGNF